MWLGSGEGGVLDLLWKNWRAFLGSVFTLQGGGAGKGIPSGRGPELGLGRAVE